MSRLRFIFFGLVVMFFFSQCEKDAFDYRNPYIGDWKFDVNQSEFNTDSVGYSSSETYIYDGKIKYGGERNTILIKYGASAEMEIIINEEGDLFFKSYYSSGEFTGDDKLHIFTYNGGLGGGISLDIEGSKK